ncbi:uncharacterized protein LOC8277127 [Ricinus communis]|uniref:RIN4 pathogenic type III effector avirulence factor Avr cleavage site domain-containing protein n=1 Tax=Ricinus communis TaxID=3988 RepID=B9SHK9_RICCO|nr:uncharacterized protein LOC8277127 [Ricinus communis]EEF36968.1 hypothetical protein RCOM_1122760 [Ricinus communis]|eukprot:XP_002525478.1 uncharacterized protein LOC8277127 [Ricinus communis]
MDEWKRSGQIPAFGDWEHANELPITQYFECARQAGLIRYSSSGECEQYMRGGSGGSGSGDLYATDVRKPSRDLGPPPRKTRGVSGERNSRVPSSLSHVKEQKKQGRVCDVTEPPRKQHQAAVSTYSNASNAKKDVNGISLQHRPRPVRPSKAVDEDLYKIPPELLRSSKRKKMPGLFACLVPACAS